MILKIQKYMRSQSRNKIFFYLQDIPGIQTLDVGKELSHEIKSIASDAKIGMKSLIIIDDLFTSSIWDNSDYGKNLSSTIITKL